MKPAPSAQRSKPQIQNGCLARLRSAGALAAIDHEVALTAVQLYNSVLNLLAELAL